MRWKIYSQHRLIQKPAPRKTNENKENDGNVILTFSDNVYAGYLRPNHRSGRLPRRTGGLKHLVLGDYRGLKPMTLMRPTGRKRAGYSALEEHPNVKLTADEYCSADYLTKSDTGFSLH